MKIGIMQPYLFSYLGYFQLIKSVDKFIVLDDVNYIKGGWINRNSLLIDKRKGRFTVPLKKSSSFKPINEIKISDNSKWKIKLLKTINQNYKDAPYYNTVIPVLSNIINSEHQNISELIYFSLTQLNDYLCIDTLIIKSSIIYDNKHLIGQERVIDICKQEMASHYINAIGGQDLYDPKFFLKNNIKLNFIQSSIPEYVQFQNDFVPGLSIIDVLMFNSKEEVGVMLKDYNLV
ncbi:WbqC family protein [Gillisia sp. CAL575]|uniref:WbqC family protein n=1 Tax=Gillisia sp. CAL575 TaxID=985255 RepID=UPI0003A2B2AF|nr:WbqC family protein [Gillisia sp. CAL575]